MHGRRNCVLPWLLCVAVSILLASDAQIITNREKIKTESIHLVINCMYIRVQKTTY